MMDIIIIRNYDKPRFPLIRIIASRPAKTGPKVKLIVPLIVSGIYAIAVNYIIFEIMLKKDLTNSKTPLSKSYLNTLKLMPLVHFPYR